MGEIRRTAASNNDVILSRVFLRRRTYATAVSTCAAKKVVSVQIPTSVSSYFTATPNGLLSVVSVGRSDRFPVAGVIEYCDTVAEP
jgi:hypothetical protein